MSRFVFKASYHRCQRYAGTIDFPDSTAATSYMQTIIAKDPKLLPVAAEPDEWISLELSDGAGRQIARVIVPVAEAD